jgi:outer membrane protein OmpA-like peptidoglycan-associated protein
MAGAVQCSPALEDQLAAISDTTQYEKFIMENQPCELAFVAVQRLAAPFLQAGDWQAAADVFSTYRGAFPGMDSRFGEIIDLLNAPAENVKKRRLGPGVNSKLDEFRPIISADGSTLLFSRNRGPVGGGEDVYRARREGEYWYRAKNVGPPISTDFHEMPLAVSADNRTLLLYGNYEGGPGRGDIYYAEFNGKCWTIPEPLPEPVNSVFFDSDGMLAADGRAILFISERPGGVGEFHPKDDLFHGSYAGNTDIYVYVENDNGTHEAINLGPVINTPYAEYSPFLHPDGKTLYFSSDGHPGLGGLDVFKSTRLSDSWTDWSKPVNLGKEINTALNDWGYQINTAGDRAYFAAKAMGERRLSSDIFSVKLPPRVRPQPVVLVYGKVTDPAGAPLEAQIKWNNLSENKEAGQLRSNPADGTYNITLPGGHMFSYYADKEGFVGSSEHIDLTGITGYSEQNVDIVLHPVATLAEEKVAVRLNSIFFDFDRYELRPESFMELDRWVKFLADNPSLQVQIHGHTDSMGTEIYNRVLSENRAQAVVTYLIGKGVDRQRIKARGFGESRPVAGNDTPEGRQRNRRVEIVFGR